MNKSYNATLSNMGSLNIPMSDNSFNSISKLLDADLSFLVEQLTWKDGYSALEAEEIVNEYSRWLVIKILSMDSVFLSSLNMQLDENSFGMPSKHIDCAWHRHILFTETYWEFCHSVLGEMINHLPCTKSSISEMSSVGTFYVYHRLFGQPTKYWLDVEDFLKKNRDEHCGASNLPTMVASCR